MTPQISTQEAVDLFRKAILGEVSVRLEDSRVTWNGVYCGDVGFMFNNWLVVFFNDCYELDYTDQIKAPDGRESCFDDWYDEIGYGCPLCLLSVEEHQALEDLLEAAA